MLIQILLSLFAGILAGIFTGLIPGIHINTLGIILISLSMTILSPINPIYLIVFITSMAIIHTFLDFIPSILLGCPDTDTELSVLPGHELLKQGQGYQAIILTAYGSLAAIFAIILVAFPAILTIEKIYNLLTKQFVMPVILIFISLFLIFLEKKKLSALFVFILTGALGLCVLNLPSLNQPLLPLLTGLFGGSMLILSIKNKIQIPEQKITKPKTKLFKPLLGSLIASPLCSFLPGLGSGQAAIIGNLIARANKKGFLILLGATNTLVMGFSFISLYVISKTRTGAAVAIQELLPNFSNKILILILTIILLTGIISFFLTKFLAKFFSNNLNKINYTKISLATLLILILVILLVSNFLGLIVLVISTLTGIYCIKLKVKRTQMMGCLLLPTIILYLT